MRKRVNRDGKPLCEATLKSIPGELCRNVAVTSAGERRLCMVHANEATRDRRLQTKRARMLRGED